MAEPFIVTALHFSDERPSLEVTGRWLALTWLRFTIIRIGEDWNEEVPQCDKGYSDHRCQDRGAVFGAAADG